MKFNNEFIESTAKRFIELFENTHPLQENMLKEVYEFQNCKHSYEKQANKVLDLLTKSDIIDLHSYHGIAFIGYGLSYAIIINKGKAIPITHKIRHNDTSVWKQNGCHFLNIKTNQLFTPEIDIPISQKDQIEIGEYLKWFINPISNKEIFDDVFQSICYQIIHEIIKRLPSNKTPKIIKLICPLISNSIDDIDWDLILSNLNYDNISVEIDNDGIFKTVDNNQRIYYFYKHTWDFDTCYIGQVIERYNNNKIRTIGMYAWLESEFNHVDNLNSFYPMKCVVNTTVRLFSIKNTKIQDKSQDENTSLRTFDARQHYERPIKFTDYLDRHSDSFYLESYTKIENTHKNELINKIYKFMKSDSLDLHTICSYLLNEPDLTKISLSDMVSIGIVLESESAFATSSPLAHTNNKQKKTFTSKKILKHMENNIESIPSNFGSFRIKNKDKNNTTSSYIKMSNHELKNLPLCCLIQLILNHFSSKGDTITVSILAEELYWIYEDKEYEPSALFVANLFQHLSESEIFELIPPSPNPKTNNIKPKENSKT